MTLTEQWKKGELDAGWYYITTSFTDEALREYFDGDEFRTVFTCNVKEVLSPVPSYDEWQELSKQRNQLIRDVKDLAYIQEENAKLKELLNYIRDEIADMPSTAMQLGFGWISEAAYRIDNVIGENK